jgi:hypothetical protein
MSWVLLYIITFVKITEKDEIDKSKGIKYYLSEKNEDLFTLAYVGIFSER